MSLFRRRGAATPPGLDDAGLRAVWQVASLLLDYPDERLVGQLPVLRAALAAVPAYLADPLLTMVSRIEEGDLGALQRAYVETFDHTRRHCLHLTYFTYGDTRRRGVALVRVKQAYRRAGAEPSGAELPDHLAVVLEFGAAVDVAAARSVLLEHRASLEVLRLALDRGGSPWAVVVTAVCRTLPPLVGEEEQAVARLIAEGPPAEEVGLDGYSLDPRLNPVPDYLTGAAR